MKKEVTHNGNVFIVETSVWTGKVSLTVNGVPAKSLGKKLFRLDTPDSSFNFEVLTNKSGYGSVSIITPEGEVVVEQKVSTVYFVLSIVLPVIAFIFGAIKFSVIGGALGGAMAVISFFVNIAIARTKLAAPLKVIVMIVASAACAAIYILAALAILGAFAA